MGYFNHRCGIIKYMKISFLLIHDNTTSGVKIAYSNKDESLNLYIFLYVCIYIFR